MAQTTESVFKPEELNSTVWSKTPHDILNLIIEQSDRATQDVWSRTGPAFYDFSSALLWREISIDREDFHTYWEWTWTRPPLFNPRPDNGGILDFLIRGPAHQDFCQMSETILENRVASPRTRIKHLFLDLDPDMPRKTAPITSPITSPEIEIVLGFFALFMTRLASLSFDGPLSQGSLGQIVKFEVLRELDLGRLEYYERGLEHAASAQARGLRRIPWATKLTLDFTCLFEMQSLRTLKIGRLATLEAQGLAKAIRRLRHLTFLSISACYSLTANEEEGLLEETPGDVSPLIPFLEALSSRGDEANEWPGDGISGGFPIRLKTLVLEDRYHSNLPSLNRILQSAVKPCEKLPDLRITFFDPTIAKDFLCSLGLPVQQDGKTASLDMLCSVAGLEYSGSAARKHACVIKLRKTDSRYVEIVRISEAHSDEAA